jgi:hypothetical protein
VSERRNREIKNNKETEGKSERESQKALFTKWFFKHQGMFRLQKYMTT